MINHPKALLCVEHIEKYYGNQGSVTKALNQVSFFVQHGEFVSIMGASGSGKTTLLNCISTIDTVSAGHILLDGKDITTISEDDISVFRRDNLGFVFQDFNLLDTLTLEENIALPLTIGKVPLKEITERVNHIAQRLQISDTLKKFPFQVSGGQKQRCAFARAIICSPKLIMADESTGEGVRIRIVIWKPDSYGFGDSAYWMELQGRMRGSGFETNLVGDCPMDEVLKDVS